MTRKPWADLYPPAQATAAAYTRALAPHGQKLVKMARVKAGDKVADQLARDLLLNQRAAVRTLDLLSQTRGMRHWHRPR